MVYLRPCTSVFYIIQVTGVRIQVSAASALMRVCSNSALLREVLGETGKPSNVGLSWDLRSLLAAM
jgi:hypothetical protein